jgi:hypothetical protein
MRSEGVYLRLNHFLNDWMWLDHCSVCRVEIFLIIQKSIDLENCKTSPFCYLLHIFLIKTIQLLSYFVYQVLICLLFIH